MLVIVCIVFLNCMLLSGWWLLSILIWQLKLVQCWVEVQIMQSRLFGLIDRMCFFLIYWWIFVFFILVYLQRLLLRVVLSSGVLCMILLVQILELCGWVCEWFIFVWIQLVNIIFGLLNILKQRVFCFQILSRLRRMLWYSLFLVLKQQCRLECGSLVFLVMLFMEVLVQFFLVKIFLVVRRIFLMLWWWILILCVFMCDLLL